MNKTIKAIITALVLVMGMLVLISCAELTPYDKYDSEGYTVSVKYDANGGMFTTSVEVIVDSYELESLPTGANGKKQVALLSPDDERRGTGNAFKASNAGYFLAGWYTERVPVLNDKGEHLDADGTVAAVSGKPGAYTYSGRWDFENDRLEIDPNTEHTSKESVTLYAAWIPEFKYEFYSLKTGELINSYSFDPNYVSEITMPSWDEKTGKLKMEKFPTVSDMTLDGVYLDAQGSEKAQGTTVKHTGTYNADSATAHDPVMKLYLDYIDGEWFHIYTAKQFIDNASVGGCYEICADLDFEGLSWKTSLMYANFRGHIKGNGHTFKNISVEQTDARKQNAGLFGQLTAEAVIEDVIFENVTVMIGSGTLQQDASFGLLAGTIDSGAKLSLTIKNSALLINGSANILDNTVIGLLCGTGSVGDIDISGIRCEATGENAADIVVTVNGNDVTVSMAP